MANRPSDEPRTARPSDAAGKSAAEAKSEAFQLEKPEASIQQVRFDLIQAIPEQYGFRREGDADPYGKEAVRSLMESIKAHGRLLTPLLLREKRDGDFVVADGHRRFFALEFLIGESVQGFTHDMPIPAYVMKPNTSELAMVSMAIAGNIEREPLTFEGRLDAVHKLHRLGMPRKSIAQLVKVGESTIDRDLIVAGDEEMRNHIRRRHITASAAATLLAAAEKAGRRKEFMDCFRRWLIEANESLRAEEKAREARDLRPLPPAKRWLQNRLTAEQIAAWRRALEAGKPLDEVDRTVAFPACVEGEGTNAKILIGAVSKPVAELSSADLAKILRNCLDLAEAIEPILLAKAAAEKDGDAEAEEQRISRGQKRLIELGLAADVDHDEGDEQEGETGEPEDELKSESPDDVENA